MYANLTRLATEAYLLAAAPAPPVGDQASKVTATPLWQSVVQPLSAALGAFLVLAGIFKIVTQVLSGKTQGAFKTGALTILGGAVLFNLSIIFQLIGGGDTIVTKLINSITQLVGG